MSDYLDCCQLSAEYIDQEKKLFNQEVERILTQFRAACIKLGEEIDGGDALRMLFQADMNTHLQAMLEIVNKRGEDPHNHPLISSIREYVTKYDFEICDNQVVSNEYRNNISKQLTELVRIMSTKPDSVTKEILKIALDEIHNDIKVREMYKFSGVAKFVEFIEIGLTE